MAETRTRVRYTVTPVWEERGVLSTSRFDLDRVTATIRFSSDARELDRNESTEKLGSLTYDQAATLAVRLVEQLGYAAEDSLKWAAQLEGLGVKPEDA